ncbi:helix-turn-helix domain-containing protein [Priestia endophytica]|uniref:HTH cro/C1-type domain-containing protein n=1 Tax=Priestia endophytica TaxID=135735 RepID=A0AAX1Q6Z6_9BACI|nr:helix-turn-helix transcriptional regulator [Priestia endophytica]RAS75210.1 hypothetical protein A3864_16210 [Priestia endophytica]
MLGKRLKELRSSRKLTQTEIAAKLGITRGTYAHYEIDKRQPDYETLKKIAKYYDVNTDYLLGLTDIPKGTDEPVRFDGLHFHDMDKLSPEEIEDVKKQAKERIQYHLWKKEQEKKKSEDR